MNAAAASTERPPPAPSADERLLDLIAAALKRFGPTLRLTYVSAAAPRHSCTIVFPSDQPRAD